MNILEKTHVDLKYCLGQRYDNASEMSGVYSGLQTRIRNRNKYAIYMPCTAHFLNLVDNSAAVNSLFATKQFMLLPKLYIYAFLSASTSRWRTVTEIFQKVGNYQYEQEKVDKNVEDK